MVENKSFDVIIIGGSYSGLSAAMALGRSLRNTLVIDSGKPCNRQTPHSHNFLTQDGKTPAQISTIAKQQVEAYETVKFYNGLATNGKKRNEGFEIETASGETFFSKKLIIATGIKDIMPDIKGFSNCWGISVIHCPYCHGYEYRTQKTGIMANRGQAFHLASLVNNLTPNLTILTQGEADFDMEQIKKLKKHKIEIVENEISEIEHKNGQINNVIFKNGRKMNFDAVYAAIPFIQHSDIPNTLGCNLNEQGYIEVDPFQKTSVEGVFACGDNTTPFRSVAYAVSCGNIAGAIVNKELVEERF
nr:NAD(P)/FAD-dependent oxidoreductase [Xanthovirga aplysinae]